MPNVIVTPERKLFYTEDVAAGAATSEANANKIAASMNFINLKQYKCFEFGVQGPYYAFTSFPVLDLGVQELVIENQEIINVAVFSGQSGGGGTTEVDVKRKAVGGSFSSIFSTTPKITSSAPAGAAFDSASLLTLPAGCTRPVVSLKDLVSGDLLRLDLITTMNGFPKDLIVQVHYRPR